MNDLTKAEERIMQVCWKLKKALVRDIIAQLPDHPKPPYNTISSVVRILVQKGFLGYKAYGKTHEYHPAISKSEYRKNKLKNIMSGYFGDSPATLVSYILKKEKLTRDEITKLKKTISKIK